ncbi:hypothetical protein QVD17_06487 [Tagetes erecta]|uniref:Uncharacterized protein n=1 Tax=Tagetes erecta TaxID=13708 RepID=A0AAD8PBB7_TARER|nr:hypothetical protein QVD17_06487 [Tagetes erecta]
MAATITTQRKTRACFSFAAYSKHLITHLHHHCNVPVTQGLTQTELSAIESTFNFSFPPDLRSILIEGLPIGQGFPNWRSSSPQQLHILINLPIFGLCKQVSGQNFWYNGWGDRPKENDDAVELAKLMLERSPVLVPVYRNCYIPTDPCLSGNPVFYVDGLDVKLCSYDIVGLFQQIEFGGNGVVSGMRLGHFLNAPAWAATEARRIEFWTELVELRRVRWWGGELGRCLEDVRMKLRGGGWKDEDLDEMMMVESSPSPPLSLSPQSWSSSCDSDEFRIFSRLGSEIDHVKTIHTRPVGTSSVSSDESVRSRIFSRSEIDHVRTVHVRPVRGDNGGGMEVVVRELSRRLLRGGWSMGDVVESLGCLSEDQGDWTVEIENGGGDYLFDLEHKA